MNVHVCITHTHTLAHSLTEYIVLLTARHMQNRRLFRVARPIALAGFLFAFCFAGTMRRVLLRKNLLHTLRAAKKDGGARRHPAMPEHKSKSKNKKQKTKKQKT